ncbi:FAD-dependent monooxygenase [Actinosynnema sp. NPDC050801]|uniref:FAD-dependent oxidoreductase n=1 Tax=unclassified Actinosynnema TaxID=2637065 RepID=UPI0033E60A04
MTQPSTAVSGGDLDDAHQVRLAHSDDGDLVTDVLIIGSGPAGGAAALALATLGVEHLVITKYHWTANTPRAHITNQRTMEIFRDLGIEDDVLAQASPHELMGETVFCTSLTGDELGRVRAWGTHPAREGDYVQASPSLNCDIPQSLLEPIVIGHAASRGSRIRFDTEYRGLTQDAQGVTVRVRDRVTGTEYTIRAKYVIGADGGRSAVAADIGLPFDGQMDVAGSMNIVVHADLSPLVAHRPSVLYWVLQPGADVGGIGLGLVRMVRPWNEWLIVWGYDITKPPPEVDDEMAARIVHQLVGDDSVPVTVRSTSLWGNNKMYATHYQSGRVFCAGDAVHRHPPSNGLGSNTSIQDAYNLAWKLAYVLRGQAGEGLLDSYSAERAPIGRQIVLRANKSIEEFGAILAALGLDDTSDPERMRARIDARGDNTPEAAAQREALRKALELKNYEFNAHGVELGQRYHSDAVVPDGTVEPAPTRDPELYYQPTTRPGARLPHVWLGHPDGRRTSTHDVAGNGSFCLLTGIAGERWAEAATGVAEKLGIPLNAHVIGPGRDYIDLYDDWARTREVTEAGCVLIRPDVHIAWRSADLADDPATELHRVLTRVLALGSD